MAGCLHKIRFAYLDERMDEHEVDKGKLLRREVCRRGWNGNGWHCTCA